MGKLIIKYYEVENGEVVKATLPCESIEEAFRFASSIRSFHSKKWKFLPEAIDDRYDVIFVSCNGNLVETVKRLKPLLNLSLQKAKSLTMAAPVTIAKGVTIHEAKFMENSLRETGATIEIKPVPHG